MQAVAWWVSKTLRPASQSAAAALTKHTQRGASVTEIGLLTVLGGRRRRSGRRGVAFSEAAGATSCLRLHVALSLRLCADLYDTDPVG